MKKFFALAVIAIMSISLSMSQSIDGKWKTIDDETGKAKSIVEISIKDGKLYGKILKLFKASSEDPICNVCPGARKGKKVIGMTIITALEKDGNEWEADDAILDPKDGKIYDCKIWVDEDDSNKLNVRGYVGFFYKTQTWLRVK